MALWKEELRQGGVDGHGGGPPHHRRNSHMPRCLAGRLQERIQRAHPGKHQKRRPPHLQFGTASRGIHWLIAAVAHSGSKGAKSARRLFQMPGSGRDRVDHPQGRRHQGPPSHESSASGMALPDSKAGPGMVCQQAPMDWPVLSCIRAGWRRSTGNLSSLMISLDS